MYIPEAETRPKIGLTLKEAREALSKPVQRSAEEIAKLQSLIGLLEGMDDLPTDLSERWHDYRYGLNAEI